jgi:hypothetical protein
MASDSSLDSPFPQSRIQPALFRLKLLCRYGFLNANSHTIIDTGSTKAGEAVGIA